MLTVIRRGPYVREAAIYSKQIEFKKFNMI